MQADQHMGELTLYWKWSKTACNELIAPQEDTFYFHISEEDKIKYNKYGDSRILWVKFSRKIDPTTEAYKTILQNELLLFKLDDISRYPKDWITEIKLLRRHLQKLNVYIYNTKTMTYILLNWTEAWDNLVENI